MTSQTQRNENKQSNTPLVIYYIQTSCTLQFKFLKIQIMLTYAQETIPIETQLNKPLEKDSEVPTKQHVIQQQFRYFTK